MGFWEIFVVWLEDSPIFKKNFRFVEQFLDILAKFVAREDLKLFFMQIDPNKEVVNSLGAFQGGLK